MSDNKEITTAKKPSRITYIIIVIVIVGGIGFLFFHSIRKRKKIEEEAEKNAAPQTLKVRVVKPFLASDTAVLLLPGTIVGYRETALSARVNGYIKNWYVDIGDRVKEGQLLAEIETPELDQQLAQAKANMELAKSSLERVNSVNIEGAVSIQQKADRAGAYQASLAVVNQLQAEMSFKRVIAPFSGVITSRNIDIGTLVNAGSSSTNQLFTIAQTDKLRIFVNVPQTFVSFIKLGTEAKIIVQEIAGKPIIGRVKRTAGALNPDTRTMSVMVEFDNVEQNYLPGMYANVKFEFKRTERPFVIAANTLVIRTEGPAVVTVTPQNTIALKKVVIGKDHGATLEISAGLKGDELLVTNPSLNITEGLKVAIAQK
jgi:membrane fusion protein (multidrug efflux system)